MRESVDPAAELDTTDDRAFPPLFDNEAPLLLPLPGAGEAAGEAAPAREILTGLALQRQNVRSHSKCHGPTEEAIFEVSKKFTEEMSGRMPETRHSKALVQQEARQRTQTAHKEIKMYEINTYVEEALEEA